MNTNETIPEIVADMRTKYPPAPNCIQTVTGQYVHDEMTWLADRIEAALSRMEQHPKAKNYGNMAKIRHAAELMVEAMKKTDLCDYSEFNEKQCKACACKRLCKAVKGLEDAISLPARNCDIGTAKEQAERMANFCKLQYKKKRSSNSIYVTNASITRVALILNAL